MRKTQENKVSMYIAVKNVCEHNAKWSDIPAFGIAFDQFKSKLGVLQENIRTQTTPIGEFADQKEEIAEDLKEKSMEIAGALFAYASLISDAALKARADFARSDFSRMRDTLVIENAKQILTDAKSISGKLLDYGISEEILNDYSTKIDEYEKTVTSPREAVIERKTATETIPDMMREIDEILDNQMDRIMQRYLSKNPAFYYDYFSAREIMDEGLRKERQESGEEMVREK